MAAEFVINNTIRTLKKLSGDAFLTKVRGVRTPDARGIIVGLVSQGSSGHAFLIQHEGQKFPAIYFAKDLLPEPSYWKVAWARDGITYFKEFNTRVDAENFSEDDLYGESILITGPYYGAKELEEGQSMKNLFDHLMDND